MAHKGWKNEMGLIDVDVIRIYMYYVLKIIPVGEVSFADYEDYELLIRESFIPVRAVVNWHVLDTYFIEGVGILILPEPVRVQPLLFLMSSPKLPLGNNTLPIQP